MGSSWPPVLRAPKGPMHTDRSRGAPDAVDADVRASADAVPALPAAAPMDEIMEIMRTHGAVILLDCVPPEVCDEVVAELTPYVDNTSVGFEGFSGTQTQRCGSIVARSPASRALWAHERVMEMCDRVLGVSAAAAGLC